MVKETFTGKPKVRIRTCLLVWLVLVTKFPADAQDYTFHVQEGISPPVTIGKIAKGVPTYAFDGSHNGFDIDGKSGDIYTTSKFDRESFLPNPVIPLRVRTGDVNISSLSVRVEVDDINDNSPIFSSPVFVVQIPEKVDVGIDFPLDTANDQDAGPNGTVVYAIVSGNSDAKFKLGTNFSECSRSSLCLITRKRLDRETTAFYQLNLSASDQGSPPLHGHCLVNITISDYNDNDPIFTQKLYNGSIAENTGKGVSVLTVKATDLDQDANGDVRYYFEGSRAHAFTINPVSGVVSTDGALDHEVTPSYTFVVVAEDLGSPPLRGRTDVIIYVDDVNEHKPQISPLQDSYTFPELAYWQVFMIVSDGDNDKITVRISSGNELGHFTVTKFHTIWKISSVGSLDREDVPMYNLTISATDDGRPSLSSFKSLIVTLKDVNDNPPTFSNHSFDASVNELVQPGSFVYRVNASDADLGSNSLISYSISKGNALGWFSVDATSGIVTTAASLDRETHPVVVLTVMAKDHGSPVLNGIMSLKVTILDGNDFSPKFQEKVYNESLPEDAKIGDLIIQLTATDEDAGENKRITYEIDSVLQEVTDSFAIDLNTGRLTTKVMLDREKKSFYDIDVVAKDHGNPQRSAKTRVHLTVGDVNDNHPIYYPVVYFKTLSKGEPPQEIMKVSAEDIDLDNNGIVFYEIAQGNRQGLFAINQTSGVIRTVQSISTPGLYTLQLTARDGGGLYAVQNATADITVLGGQDDPPVFKHHMYNYSLYENVPKGTLVGRVFATTKDPKSLIVYSIVSGDPDRLFAMDSAGGIIKVYGAIDREEKSFYFLGIVAMVSSLSASAYVNVEVLDENDNSPEFLSSIVQVKISGNLLAGERVYHALATDTDAGLNGVVRYRLTEDASGRFRINATSGEVKLASQILGRDGSQYNVKIRASDLGSPPRHTSLTLTVSIFTNHPPRFINPSYTVPVSGNIPLGKQFLVVSAVDSDSGENGVVQYSIAVGGDTEGLFGIFADGSLYAKKPLTQAQKSIYDISVVAKDNGSPPLNASVPVSIIIQLLTEHRTLFTSSTFQFSIPENCPPGTQVGLLTARASDPVKTMDIVYSFISNQANFAVSAKTGEITTKRMLDRERVVEVTGNDTFIMLAEAVYNDTTVKRDRAIVVVQLTDLNDNVPTFARQLYHTSVLEGSLPGSVVFRLMARDPDKGSNADIVYSIVGGTGVSKFYINATHGILFLREELDRESKDHYTLEVRAVDAENLSMFTETVVEIRVEDSNDNRPLFQADVSVVNISESLPVKSFVTIMNATDKDTDINGELMYTITSGNLDVVFSIDHSTGTVILIKSLDYETEKQYRMNITVKDQGIPPLSSQAELIINVIDANDNKPVFVDQLQVVTVNENVAKNKGIGTCSATDGDSGLNAKIVYSIQSQEPAHQTFGINPQTCAIYTLEKLDREMVSQYKVVVKATDQAVPPSSRLFATKEITVQVQDLNDNSPRFVSPPAAPVAVSASIGTSVMTISAVDPDEGTNAQVTYSISSGSTDLFRLNQNTGKLETQKVLDNKLIYTLTISAQDNGMSRCSNSTTVTIFKEGSGGPPFTSSTYKTSVLENSPVGKSVVTVKAEYPQNNQNAQIEYFITSDNSEGKFQVEKTTGLVTTADLVDRESPLGPLIILKVFAVDLSGSVPRTSSASVEVRVLDKNDNSPRFLAAEYRASIAENSGVGAVVTTQVSASDKDSGENARLQYEITGGNDENKFTINSSTAVISLLSSLDREVRAEYRLNVTAKDHGNPALSSMCIVIVTVKDIDDNAPQFTSQSNFYSFAVYEDADVGTSVGAVSATDEDIGENARVTYHVSKNDAFDVEPSTGALRVIGSLDRETEQIYILNVSASDKGHASFIAVYISVLDRNDNAPSFASSPYSASVSEAADINSPVLTVSAVDHDHGTNAMISYNIISGNSDGTFSVLSNGTIVNSKPLDREKKNLYHLEVTATDQAQPASARLSRTAQVSISVTDVNDNTPYFTSKNVAHVSENAQSGDVVMTMIAVDLDEGSNSDIDFSLKKIDIPFSLGSKDGVLRVKGMLDRDIRDQYSVEVTASDQGNPPKSSQTRLSIIVDDFNDNSPVFQPHNSLVEINEDISVVTEILRLSASDGDLGSNAEVRFNIVSGNTDGAFDINGISGSLETAKPLDREKVANYSLEIRAYDLGIPQQSTVTRITVVLLDLNDNSPRFEKPLYTASVSENKLVPSFETVAANDLDDGKNGEVMYEIVSGDSGGAFVINQHSGQISLKKKLDREKETKYTLVVKASDWGQPQRSDQTKVIVNVLDENDNDPVFHPDKLKAAVQENAPDETYVYQVSAMDADFGSNAKLTYSLDKSSPDSDFFKINPASGTIMTLTTLDREREEKYELMVFATDEGSPKRSGTVSIDVTVEDVNDQSPVFNPKQYRATVRDGANSGAIVFMVSATDADIGMNAESTYTITSGDTSVFKVNQKTGIITALKTIPSRPSSYSLVIKATNQIAPQHSDTASVQILVKRGPFPYFLHPAKSLNVSELVQIGSVLLKLNATGHTAYRIAAGNVGDVFDIDVQGNLKVKNNLNYGEQTKYVLVVEAKVGSSPPRAGYIDVSITVIDENNNSPVFSKAFYRATITEDQASNETVTWVSASDADTGVNAETEYSILQEGSGYSDFGISTKTGRLFTRVKLDRENAPSYTLKVRAENVRDRSWKGEATVEVIVLDVDDNAPVFQGSLLVSMLETADVGSDVILLTATDKDEGSHGHVKYGFAKSGNPGGFFSISPEGKVTLVKKLDHERSPEFKLLVTANDTRHSTPATLTVMVVDVNDNPPQFHATPYIKDVPERSSVGTPVMNVSASDADSGSYSESLYTIFPSMHSDLFSIERRSGIITLNKVLVYQKSSAQPNPNIYNLTVQARNVWSPFFQESVSVVIQITDINDHAPQFTLRTYSFSITKNSGAGEHVGQVRAVDDKDDGKNAKVSYDLSGGNGTALFTISTATGKVTTARNLQTSGLFYIRIRARDQGFPIREDFANVYIDVTEPNAHAPVFSLSFFSFKASEALGLGGVVDSVSATDKDSGVNGQLTYAIVSGNTYGFFGIGRKNGSIYAAKSLDFEFGDNYRLNVTATDGGSRSLSSSATVSITLLDVNDNPPVFSPQVYQLKIAENTISGTSVGKVSATDRDKDPVTYEIADGDGRNFFSINASTGVIKSKVMFDYEHRNSYDLSVIARDPAFASWPRAQVHIDIIGVNEFSPKFQKAVYRLTVAENALPGLSVDTLSATDPDQGPDGIVMYLLLGSNDQGFRLNPYTGVLSVSGNLDSEKHGLVTLQVIAKNLHQDIVTPANSDLASVIVTVTDANDKPRFPQSEYRAQVQEDAGINTFVANVTAVDDDASQAGDARLAYGITQGNTGSVFVIDSVTGVIRTAGNLDRETISQYRLTVSATDNGTPPLSGTATVVISLGDVNDNPPTLVNCIGHVKENQPSGSDVTDLRPTDPDISPNQGPYTFSITDSNYGKFQLHSMSGKITTTAKLDREQRDKYNLSIKITDNGSPKKSAISHCLLVVDDENDNPPIATSRTVHMTSFDKTFPGGLLGNIQPEDVDQVNSMTCKILSSPPGSPAFTFPRGNCELSAPPYKGSGEFSLTLKGSDGRASVDYSVMVNFLAYTAATLNESVVLRLKDASPQKFLQHSYANLLKAMNGVITPGYIPQFFSISSGGQGLVDVVVAVQRANSFAYMTRESVAELFVRKESLLETQGNVVIDNVDYTACTANTCQNQAECTSYMRPKGYSSKIETIPVIFHSVNYEWHYSCHCKRGYAGRHCENIANACNKNPCNNGGTCEDLPGNYSCKCKPGFTGKNCEMKVDFCAPSPCMFNSTCVNKQTSFQCVCDYGGRGDLCQYSSLGFDPVSYVMLPTLKGSADNNITLQFATSKQKGLLFYNSDGQYKKDSDFIALEIVSGKLRFSFNLGFGETPVVIESQKNVADGKWHTAVAIQKEKVSELI